MTAVTESANSRALDELRSIRDEVRRRPTGWDLPLEIAVGVLLGNLLTLFVVWVLIQSTALSASVGLEQTEHARRMAELDRQMTLVEDLETQMDVERATEIAAAAERRAAWAIENQRREDEAKAVLEEDERRRQALRLDVEELLEKYRDP